MSDGQSLIKSSQPSSHNGYNSRTIAGFLVMARQALDEANIDTARLDSELLLSGLLNLPREWLLAHDDAEIDTPTWQKLCLALYARCSHTPLAYILGKKEFYGRSFIVTPDVLIPRPESEQIIASLNNLIAKDDHIHTVLDIGTGSGCLAITIKLEHPELTVSATDISDKALAVARQNARQLNADVGFVKSNLLDKVDKAYDVIIANLPYVNPDWDFLSPELAYEPQRALFASDNGLALIKKLLDQASAKLNHSTGYLILEMDNSQIDDIISYAGNLGYRVTDRQPFTLTLQYINASTTAH